MPTSPLGRIFDRANLYLHARRIASREIASGEVLAVHHLGPCGEQSPSLIGHIPVPLVYGPLPGSRPVQVADDEWLSWLLATNATTLQAWVSILASKSARPISRSLWRRTIRLADAITVEAMASTPPGFRDVVVIPPGIDTAQFSPDGHGDRVTGRVIAVGRLIARKGYDLLIGAMSEVVRSYRPAHLLIVGTGPEEGSLRVLARRLGLNSSVTFAGNVSRSKLPELLRTAEVFCHPAVWDNVPFALLEAMACGLPPVVSSTGGLVEMVGGAGLVYQVGDEAALAARLLEVLSGLRLSRLLGAAARERVVQYFTWDRMCDSYLDLYKTMAATK